LIGPRWSNSKGVSVKDSVNACQLTGLVVSEGKEWVPGSGTGFKGGDGRAGVVSGGGVGSVDKSRRRKDGGVGGA
jgi:hypothetical protein